MKYSEALRAGVPVPEYDWARYGFSGQPGELADWLAAHPLLDADLETVQTSVRYDRPEQRRLRDDLVKLRGSVCAVCGPTPECTLDAAHLPGRDWRLGHNTTDDAILLRADLHRLLDAGLAQIDGGIWRCGVAGYERHDGARLWSEGQARKSRPPTSGQSAENLKGRPGRVRFPD